MAILLQLSGFQSTPSPRRETSARSSPLRSPVNFNPLPPQGGRLYVMYQMQPLDIFQSTPSPRRETVHFVSNNDVAVISIHSLPKEGDDRRPWLSARCAYFNPLPPQGGRLPPTRLMRYCCSISIHSLPKEGDHSSYSQMKTAAEFQSTPSPRRETLA